MSWSKENQKDDSIDDNLVFKIEITYQSDTSDTIYER